MRSAVFAPLLSAALLIPAAAHAGFVLEGSLGKGVTVSPDVDDRAGPTSVLIAPGYGLGEMLRAELGFVFDMADGNSSTTNLRLRPMLVIAPPVLPVYGRLVLGVTNLLEGDRHIEYGGAVGASMSIAGLGIFAEAGVIPQSINDQLFWVLEGRAGAYFAL